MTVAKTEQPRYFSQLRGVCRFPMIHILEFSQNMWGYVTHMFPCPGTAGETPDGRHFMTNSFEHAHPGVADSRVFGAGFSSGFGYVRPWDVAGVSPDELHLQERWQACRVPHVDYYVGLRHGSPDPVALLYPERVFVYGVRVDEELDEEIPLERCELLRHLKALDLRGQAEFWHPVQIYHGRKGGWPLFHAGVKADTDMGVSWYTVTSKMQRAPEGYSWEFAPTGLNSHGKLTYESEELPA